MSLDTWNLPLHDGENNCLDCEKQQNTTEISDDVSEVQLSAPDNTLIQLGTDKHKISKTNCCSS